MRRPAALLAVTLLVVSAAACGEESSSDGVPRYQQPTDTPTPTATAEPGRDRGRVRVAETIATGLAAPWGLAFLPDGTAIVTERDTRRVVAIGPDRKVRRIGDFGEAAQQGEAGLLGVAVSPTFDEDRLLFFYVTSQTDNRIVRAEYRDGRLGVPEPILTGIPSGAVHDGGRLAFGPDGYLYASTGETGDRPLAQDPASLGGKVLRIDSDGNPASDNPDPSSPVFTLGHRNVQGLAFDDDGNLWASEFGDQEFDELNLLRAGRDYGWPEVEGTGGAPAFEDPQVTWRTSEASPSGLAWLDGRLWMASLRGERLWSVRVTDGEATHRRAWFVGRFGRLRTVAVAPDGTLWVTTSNRDTRGDPRKGDDRILALAVS
ncbi:PQQ-dependent sugar dehydrogenase [Nocardioides daejeonensis]|uniref:PQQ-dependent sugar dehydrogenase n=1 Tax=Nocardioides daejeonensis TaxID=1046556 RepID=UPI000D744B29|nr:PQQ-dependent sugar dehydrogenase [Nocardioides daejeonensis]